MASEVCTNPMNMFRLVSNVRKAINGKSYLVVVYVVHENRITIFQ